MAAASAAVSPPPSAGPVPHHPPYKEMIVRAIESLKEKNGSSRKAISKYIAVNYFGLPLKHEALLSTHINRLKKNGVITTVKHSYMMSGDVSGAAKRRVAAGDSSGDPVVTPKRRGRPSKADLANSAAPLPKRGRLLKAAASGGRRGRPPKMSILADAAAAAETGDHAAARRPGRPRKVRPVRLIFPTGLKLRPASKLATQRSKRQKPGRPGKVLGGSSAAPLLKKQRLERLRRRSGEVSTALAVDVDGSLGERRRGGRPKKILQTGVNTASGHVDGSVGSVGKRKPGRPAKATNSVLGSGKRRPGRPSKIEHASGHVVQSAGKKKPGRLANVAFLVSGDVEGSAVKRKPGRPSKAVHPVSAEVEGSMAKRKPGRLVKTVNPVSAEVDGSVRKKQPGGRRVMGKKPVSAEVEGSVGKKPVSAEVEVSAEEIEGSVKPVSEEVEVSAEGSVKPVSEEVKVSAEGTVKPVSAEVEGSVELGGPADAASPESGDVEGSARKRKPGWLVKVVERDGETPTEKRKSKPSQKLLQISFGSKNGAAGASSRKRKRGRAKPGRPKKVADDLADKKELSQPQKVMNQSLNSANDFVEASSGKRKQGQPKRIVLSNLTPVDGAVKISDGGRRPRQMKKAVLPDLNLTNEDVVHQNDTDQHAGAVGSVDGKLKMVSESPHIDSEFPDIDKMIRSVFGLPNESANGEGDTSIKLQKDVQTGLNGDMAKERAVVNGGGGGTTLMNSSHNSIGKRKLGQPKKPSQVDEDTTLLAQIQTSSGKLVGVAEPAPDPVPAAVDVLLGMRNPGTPSGKVSTTHSAAGEDGGDVEGSKLGPDGPVALTASAEKQQPGRAKKLFSSPAKPGNSNVMMLNPVLSSPGEVVREVEIVMPTFKKRRVVKKIR